MIKLGAHMSTSKGFDKVPEDTIKIGGNTFQIFPHSPRMWRASLPEDKVTRIFKSVKKTKHDLFLHGPLGLSHKPSLVQRGGLGKVGSVALDRDEDHGLSGA